MTLVRRRVSPKVRSSRLVCRTRWQCSVLRSQVGGEFASVDLCVGGVIQGDMHPGNVVVAP
jgi:hypothetical protein